MAVIPENTGLHITGVGSLRRINHPSGNEQPLLANLPIDFVSMTPKANVTNVADPRLANRGNTLFSVVDPQPATGQLTVLSVPPPVLAMLLMGTQGTISDSGGSVTGENHAFTAGYGIQLAHNNVGNVVVKGGAKALLATGTEGNDNALNWIARSIGTGGNAITVTLSDPSENSQPLTVSVNGTDIVVSLATNGTGAITSTANQVRIAVVASAAASALVSIANKGASDGTGVMATLTTTHLAGGSLNGTAFVAGRDYEIISAHEGQIRPISTGTMGASGTVAVDYDYGTVTGTSVSLGGDCQIECEVRFSGINDLPGPDGIPGLYARVYAPRMLLTPKGLANLTGKDVIKAEFEAMPLPPSDGGKAFSIQFPTYAAVT